MAVWRISPVVGQSEAPMTKITVNAGQPGVKVSPSLWGIFLEEVNHAGDGGIYAELVQNRAFEEIQPAAGYKMVGVEMVTPKGFKNGKWYKTELHAWSLIADGNARATAPQPSTSSVSTARAAPGVRRIMCSQCSLCSARP